MHRSLSVLCLALLAASAGAADIYRWTDAQGRVHLTDRPPPEGTPVQKQDSKRYDVSPAERDAALRRAQADRDRLNAIEAARNPASGARAAASAASATKAAASQAGAPPRETTCQRKQREFQASAACYAGFHTAGGGVKGGAAEKCGPPVADPSAECATQR